jgi:calcineurin-like phosphoesterase family protein
MNTRIIPFTLNITPDTFLISDTHFFHTNIMSFAKRPYHNVDEMNEAMVKKWNSVVGEDDDVLHMGDVSFGRVTPTIEILERLNGNKYLIRGNHDYNKHCQSYLKTGVFLEVFKGAQGFRHEDIVYSHKPVPTTVLPKNCINIHGHTHNNNPSIMDHPEFKKFNINKYINTSVEKIDYTPTKLKNLYK